MFLPRTFTPSQQIITRLCARTAALNIPAGKFSCLSASRSLSRFNKESGPTEFISPNFHDKNGATIRQFWGKSKSVAKVIDVVDDKPVKEYKGDHHHDDDDVMPASYSLPVEENMAHPIWAKDKLEYVKIKHQKPEKLVDALALMCVKLLRTGFDITSGYAFGGINERKWIRRIVFLETVAGVPGMMGAMVRHLNSLRKMKRDNGWIHTLLEEAENERMHLMVALQLQKPGYFFRLGTLITQGVFTNFFFLAYLFSSRFCHRFVGYLEEEAVVTYTKLIEDIDKGKMGKWKKEIAPAMAIRYWKLPKDATKRDMILAIRADEAHHRLVNHSLANIKPDERNPFAPKET